MWRWVLGAVVFWQLAIAFHVLLHPSPHRGMNCFGHVPPEPPSPTYPTPALP